MSYTRHCRPVYRRHCYTLFKYGLSYLTIIAKIDRDGTASSILHVKIRRPRNRKVTCAQVCYQDWQAAPGLEPRCCGCKAGTLIPRLCYPPSRSPLLCLISRGSLLRRCRVLNPPTSRSDYCYCIFQMEPSRTEKGASRGTELLSLRSPRRNAFLG